MNKDIIKKLEKQLLQLRNSKSDYEKFISKFKNMVGDDVELLDWINQNFE